MYMYWILEFTIIEFTIIEFIIIVLKQTKNENWKYLLSFNKFRSKK
jgi:hypothetical protein